MGGMSEAIPDVLILGGGVIGLACAVSLLQAGRSVHLLERQTIGSGTSHGNCGTITPSHALPLAAPGAILVKSTASWPMTGSNDPTPTNGTAR